MNESTCIYIEHCLNPQKQRRERFVQKTLSEMAPAWNRPFIALVDDKPVLRRDWELTIYAEHVVVFIDASAIPQGGGGGSNPLRLIASLAVIAFSMWAGPWAAGAMGFLPTGIVGSALSGAALFGGMMLVNALIPPVTQSATSGDLPAASPTYSLQAQGNYARLEAPIPEHFGRHIAYPDFGAQPYSEAHGNEIYLYELFVVGRGRYSIEKIMIEDTEISNFEDVEYEIIPPGGNLTLFPANVENSDEVSGQDMPTGTYVGPFAAVSEGSSAIYLGVDFAAPRGLYYANDDGGLNSQTVSAIIEARLIDDNGTAIGSWVVVKSVMYSGKTTTPQRYSEKISVSSGRYEVRVKRTDTEQTGTRYGHDLTWTGLRSYLPDTSSYGDVTLLAVKMRASSQLSAQSSRKVNLIATRKLPAWNGSTWTDYTDTRSIAWAAAYCCKEAGLPDARVDLDYLLYLDAVWSSRGDECNGRIDSTLSFWEALTKICAAGRCKPYQQGGIIRFHRDQHQEIPVSMFSTRNIVRNSFSVQYIMPSEDTADSVKVSYFDADVWKQRQVLAALDGSSGVSPAKVQLDLVTSRNRALENGLWQAACNQRRRKIISFQTEMDGFIPSYGDLVLIQHDMPAWGQGGEIIDAYTDIDGRLVILTSDVLEWEDGTSHYIAMNKQDGSTVGPFLIIEGADGLHATVTENIGDFFPFFGSNAERTRYTFGPGEAWAQKALVLSVKPRGQHSVQIEAVNEDESVHTADMGYTVAAPQTSQLVGYTGSPVVYGLIARSMPDAVDVMVLSWTPSPWAEYYLVEISSGGNEWTRIGEPSAANFTALAIYGSSTVVRVAAVGATRGPWIEVHYGSVADYMWIDGDSDTLMWSTGDDAQIMWS